MSPFEFFFTFYGLLLGFSVAELVGGFSRLLRDRGWRGLKLLTALLGLFLVLDLATFWNQAWLVFRQAPYNFALLIVGLVVASVFYVAASLVFPHRADVDLDEHFWRHRRTVILSALGANLLVIGLILWVTSATGEITRIPNAATLWGGAAFFSLAMLVAAMARGRKVVLVTLVLLIAYTAVNIGRSASALAARGGWPVFQAPAAPR